MSFTSFKRVWLKMCADINITKPREDVCATCSNFQSKISRALTEDDRISTTDALRSHVNKAIDVSDYYQSCISKSKIAHSEEEADIRFVLSAIRKARISRVQLQQASVIELLNTTQKRSSVPPVHVKTYILYITYTPNTGHAVSFIHLE